jgi:hypothetical protein
MQIIPATSGWWLTTWFAGDTDFLVHDPIVAWEIDDCRVTPITIHGTPVDMVWAIKRPDGIYETSAGHKRKAEEENELLLILQDIEHAEQRTRFKSRR